MQQRLYADLTESSTRYYQFNFCPLRSLPHVLAGPSTTFCSRHILLEVSDTKQSSMVRDGAASWHLVSNLKQARNSSLLTGSNSPAHLIFVALIIYHVLSPILFIRPKTTYQSPKFDNSFLLYIILFMIINL
jgi:hypothetical protein